MSRNEEQREPKIDDRPEMTIEEQARIAGEFLEGLVSAFGLEGTVTTKVEEDVIVADVDGEQTEALVGVRGSVRSAIHELTRTVMQRYAQDTARLRLDIAGYAERRRQALTIYAERLIDQLLEEGGEIMLEPMSPADRKVIHDAAAARDGVSSYSEGEAPRRYVVLNATKSVAAEEE
jgi:spoIIIJ-associated protein